VHKLFKIERYLLSKADFFLNSLLNNNKKTSPFLWIIPQKGAFACE